MPSSFSKKYKQFIVYLFLFVSVFNFVLMVPQNAHAMASKIAGQVAKKVAKELVEDAAVNMAMDIVFNYQMEQMMSDNYKVDPGYKAVCLDNKTDCTKPVQLKEALSTTDKKVIGDKVEELLETKSYTHAGWGKWLDYIVPIFLAGTAINWLTTALDPDTEDLFDQVAKESLIDTGLMKPLVPEKEKVLVDQNGNPVVNPTDFPLTQTSTSSYTFSDFLTSREIKFVSTNSVTSTYNVPLPNTITPLTTSYIHLQRNVFNTTSYVTSDIKINYFTTRSGENRFFLEGSDLKVQFTNATDDWSGKIETSTEIYVLKNGNFHGVSDSLTSSTGTYNLGSYGLNNISDIKIYPMYLTYSPKRVNKENNIYAERYVELTVNNDTYAFYISMLTWSTMTPKKMITPVKVYEAHTSNTNTQLSHKITIFTDVGLHDFTPYNPTINDLLLKGVQGNVKVLPPIAIPIKTPEGVPVKPDGNGGWVNYNDNTPVIVDEDTLIAEDPIKTPDGIVMPDGTQIPDNQEPTPTPSDIDQLGNNLPKELILALLDMLRSILYYMVRLVTFVLTISSIPAKPLPYEALQFVFNFEFAGIKLMSYVRTTCIFFLSLGLFRILKKVF